jgi:hypothetical protein
MTELCPNCSRPHAGLVSDSVHQVTHCGCFYEATIGSVLHHFLDPVEQGIEREYQEALADGRVNAYGDIFARRTE